MTRPAIFFDRDNTLIIGNDYLGDPAKVVLVAGAADAVARARTLGYATVVVSNQSGVARGMFGEDDVRAVNTRMDEMLQAENPDAIIDRHEFCPFHPQAPVEKFRLDSDRRKPRPGMLHEAATEMNLDLPASWVIGDAARDVEAGKAAGCRAILFNDTTLPASPAAKTPPRVAPDFVAGSLSEAMEHIATSAPVIPPAASAPAEESVAQILAASAPDAPAEASIATSLARIPRAASDEPPPEMPEEPRPASPVISSVPSSTAKLESLAEQILHELRRSHEQHTVDFSVSKLLAGIVQVIAVSVMFLAYLNRDNPGLEAIMLLAIFLQALTCSLLIMSRQK